MYYGSDISTVQVNSGDVLKIIVTKDNPTEDANIDFAGNLV